MNRDQVRAAAQLLLMNCSTDDLKKLMELDAESNRAWLQGGHGWQMGAQQEQRDHIDAMVDKIHEYHFEMRK